MSETRPVRVLDLKQIEKKSGTVQRFLAVLRRESPDPWAARFAASGAKPPAPAPMRTPR
jgi:hypothetical protein